MNIWKDKNWAPMLLKEIDNPFNKKEYIYEIKFDGIRAIIFVSPNYFKIQTRNKVDITNLYPELKSIQKLVKKETIFDGEIVSFENDRPSFLKLQKRNHLKNEDRIKIESLNNPVTYVCFDILYQGKNLIDLSLKERKDILNKFKISDNFYISKTYNNGIDLFNKTKKLKLEGIVAKKIDDKYEINTRSSSWIKIKNLRKEKFIIGGYEKRKGNYISLLLGELKNNKLYFVGKASLTDSNILYDKVVNNKKINKSPFENYKNKSSIYITPNIKCEVKYLERTKENHLRQPIIIKEKNYE